MSNKKTFFNLTFLFLSLSLIFNTVRAQFQLENSIDDFYGSNETANNSNPSTQNNTNNFSSSEIYSCPDYTFTGDLATGSTGEDVRLLQKILNGDKRTLVAVTGVGSPGKETATFGVGTREALKRFQALFIEYVGVANGRLGPRTRTTLNAICKGNLGKKTNTATTTPVVVDKIKPTIAVASEPFTYIDTPIRAFIGATEDIKRPNLTGLIISGGTASDIRKLSGTTYSFLVTPNADVKERITLQFEADAIEDLAGNKNEIASNEWIINVFKVNNPTPSKTGSNTVNPNTTLPSLVLDDLLKNATTNLNTNSNICEGETVSQTDYNNPCFGKVPFAEQGSGGGGGGGGGGLQDLLKGLLQGLQQALGGAAGGAQDAGGTGSAPNVCACTGEPTILLIPEKGCGGRATMTLKPGIGKYVGKTGPPPAICGQKKDPDCPGGCCNPKADRTGQIVTCSVGSPWEWQL